MKRWVLGLLFPLLPTCSYAQEIKVFETRPVFVTLKEGWTLTSVPTPPDIPGKTVQIEGDGATIMMTLVGAPDGTPIRRGVQDLIDLTKETSAQYVSESVEGEVHLNPFAGAGGDPVGLYASFTDKKYVNQTPPAGEFACVTNGIFLVNGILAAVTYLSSDLDSKTYEDGLSIIKSLSGKGTVESANVSLAPAQPDTFVVPGEGWAIYFRGPAITRSQQGRTTKGIGFQANSSDGFNLSIFVEDKSGNGTGHNACADYYWPLGSRNPLIDHSTVKREEAERFVKISYRVRGEQDGIKFDIPNINLFFEYRGKWVDIHISKFPFKNSDQGIMDGFVQSVRYDTVSQP